MLLQAVDDFTQGRLFLADVKLTGAESGIQIGTRQTVVVDRQVGRRGTLPQAERVEGGSLVAAETVSVNETKDFDLFLLVLAAHATG
ncbi:hypothetical protein P4204_16710 [Pseudomonas aeruginosa]|nr:hypothetical protein [Pseudomonas aeruginosa]